MELTKSPKRKIARINSAKTFFLFFLTIPAMVPLTNAAKLSVNPPSPSIKESWEVLNSHSGDRIQLMNSFIIQCQGLAFSNRPINGNPNKPDDQLESKAYLVLEVAFKAYMTINPYSAKTPNDSKQQDEYIEAFAFPASQIGMDYFDYKYELVKKAGNRDYVPGRLTKAQISWLKWMDEMEQEMTLCHSVLSRLVE